MQRVWGQPFQRRFGGGSTGLQHCGYHFRIGARERLALLFDEGKYEELDAEVISIDPLGFVDSKPYTERLRLAKATCGLPEAIINGRGTVGDHPVVAGAMDMSRHWWLNGFRAGERLRDSSSALKERRRTYLLCVRRGTYAGGHAFSNADG